MTITDPKAHSLAPQRVRFGYRVLVLRRGGFALRWRVRSVAVCMVFLVTTVMVAAWALTSGDYSLNLGQVWAVLTGDPDAGFARVVVIEWRLPRVLAAVVFGAALGVSGAVFQSLTRNPLASPDIIGFSHGSYTGALIVIVLIHGTAGGSYLQVAAGALIGRVVPSPRLCDPPHE